jgi:soluble lytic murein transglycosylase-like protein
LFLAYNTPGGKRPAANARYPMPSWQPTGGWKVDPALVFAHTLQESQFKRNAISPAGAEGLMQVRPGTAKDIARWRGTGDAAVANLRVPAVNMEFGQSYLQYLANGDATGGLLPKVIAAYNAGPTPVARWNSEVRDGGDPLLYIESIPYWETRGYVATVLRNYWMYEQQVGTNSESRTAIAQGQWPRFPDLTRGRTIQLSYGMTLPQAD